MSPGGATMESFFTRVIGRWSDRKKKQSLQDSNRNGIPVNGSAVGAHDSPDMTEQPEMKPNERCVDWSHDDDVKDDVTTRNSINERNTTTKQTKKEEASPSENRKSSFGFFGGRQDRKSREEDTTAGGGTGVFSRRPKRFFSQQNLRAVSREESVFEAPVAPSPSTPRFAPPRFLARLLSNQKYRSNQDLPSVREGFRSHNQRTDSRSTPMTAVRGAVSTSSSSSSSRASTLGLVSPLTNVRLGPEGMEGDSRFVSDNISRDAGHPCFADEEKLLRRDGDVHARAKCQSWSGWLKEENEEEERDEASHVNRLRQNVVMGHDLSPSGRFLGEYRPRLNAHPEETSVEEAHTLLKGGFRSTNRWSLQVQEPLLRDPTTSLYGTHQQTRNPFEGSPLQEQVSSNTSFVSAMTLDADEMMRDSCEQTADQRLTSSKDRLRDEPVLRSNRETDGEDLGEMKQHHQQIVFTIPVHPPHHFKSASYDDNSRDHRRNPDVRRGHGGDTLPSRFSPDQVQTLRQRSQEFYGGYPLVQRKAISNADICQSFGDQRQQTTMEVDYRSSAAAMVDRSRATGLSYSPLTIVEPFRAGVGMSQQENDGSPFRVDSGHYRSLSMSQLTNNASQRIARYPNGFKQSPSNAMHQRTSLNSTGFSWSQLSDQDYYEQVASHHHERGVSLDSSELGQSSAIIRPPCMGPRRFSAMIEDQTFSDPELVGTFKRRSCDPTDRPLRYRYSNRLGSCSSGGGDDDTSGRRLQQQAVLNLFQKLTLAKQQRMLDTSNSSSSSSINVGCREPLSASSIQTSRIRQRPETKGWNNGIQMNRNFQRQTLTDPNCHLFPIQPELSMSSPMCFGYQPCPIKREMTSFNSFKDLEGDIELINPSHTDGSMDNDQQFNNGRSRHVEQYDKLSSDVKVGDPGTNLMNQRDASSVQKDSSLTANRPLLIQLTTQDQMTIQGQVTSQVQNGTAQCYPPPLPPKPRHLHNYSLNRDSGLTFDTEVIYANQLRQEARKLSLSTGSLRTGSSSKRDSLGEDIEDMRDLEGCDAGVFHHLPQHHHHHQQHQQQQRKMEDDVHEEPVMGCWLAEGNFSKGSLKPVEINEVSSPTLNGQSSTQLDSRDGITKIEKNQANKECDNNDMLNSNDRKEITRNVNGSVSNDSGRVQCGSGRVRIVLGCIQKENERVEDEKDHAYNKSGRVQNDNWRVQNESGRVQGENGRVQNENGRVQNENGRVLNEYGRVQNENGRVHIESGRVQNDSVQSQMVNCRLPTEPFVTAVNHHDSSNSTNDSCPKLAGNASQPMSSSTSNVTCSHHPVPSREKVPVASIRTMVDTTSGLPSRINGSVVPLKEPSSIFSSEAAHSLKNFSPDMDSSAEDESFRGLASVLCRHLGFVDEELCSVLRPPYVKASAEFVRWIFENRKVLDLDIASRLEQRCRISRTSNETSKDSKIPHSSLQTLKDELLSLVEKRLQRLHDRKQRLLDRQTENRLQEKKVTAIVREKTNSKQFEKFLSYLEQLEKVIQLLLNLSVRLSNVEKDLCNISDDTKDKQKKQLADKRLQILERLKEALELKWNIDERSQHVSTFLSDCLTSEEFNEYVEMVRIRCHVTLQSQAIEDRTEVALMQRKVLLVRCQPPQQRQSPPPPTPETTTYVQLEMIQTVQQELIQV